MKAEGNGAIGFASPAPASASASNGTGGSQGARSEASDDRFARLMRQSESRTQASRAQDTRAQDARAQNTREEESRAQARDAQAARAKPGDGSERRQARDRDDAGSRDDASRTDARDGSTSSDTSRTRDDAGTEGTRRDGAATTSTASTADAREPRDTATDTTPLDWLAGFVTPLLDVAATVAAPAAVITGDALLGGAARVLPSALRIAANVLPAGEGIAATVAQALDGSTGAASTQATAAGANTPREATAASALPAPSNSAANATANAAPTSDGAIALPAGLAQLNGPLFKDILLKGALDSADTGTGDAPNPLTAALGAHSPATRSDTGLAYTATVNPLTSMTPDLNTDQFGETVGTQLTYMADQKITHAHIRVSPTDLGTVEIALRLDGDQVHADFSSPHADVRQALEHSLPKLRDMLGQQGFQLAQADVGHRHNPQSSPQGTHDGRRGLAGGTDTAAHPTHTASAPAIRIARGLLDAYA